MRLIDLHKTRFECKLIHINFVDIVADQYVNNIAQ